MPGMSPTRGRLEFLLANDDHGCRCWKVYGCSGDFVLEKRREEKFASQEECSSDGLCWSDGGVFLIWAGDVLSGTSSNGVHHAGIIEESFGFHWWNERVPILVLTIVLILAPLVSFKRVEQPIIKSTSFFGFLLFGDQTMDDVLANFDTNLGVPYCVVLNDIVHVTKKHLVLDNKRFILITAGLIGIVFLGASFIPSIWDAFQFTGAIAAVCIGFIFPASIPLRDPHGIATRKDVFIALLMIFLAVVSSSIAIVSDINSLFNKKEEGPP